MIREWTRFLPRKSRQDVDNCVRHIIAHAFEHVPFYRRVYQHAGVDPAHVRRAEDLPRLPLISRLDLMSGGPADYLRGDIAPERLTIRHTTGTTGTPVAVHMNKMEEAFRRFTLMDCYRRNTGLTLPMVLVDVGCERKDHATKVMKRMGPVTIVRLFRTLPPDEQIRILMSVRPTIIGGRPSALWELANALRERAMDPPRPRLIASGAELLFPHARKLLEEVFYCRVTDNYNCEEAGNLAWQCPAHPDRMHPNTATVWIETVDQGGKAVAAGEEGRLVITNLYNYSSPFIRYEMGDRGTLLASEDCSCGFKGPVMRLTEGRTENFIILPDGREISPRLMYEVVNSAFPHEKTGWNMIDAILVFQIVQEKTDLIVLKIVPGASYSDALLIPVEKNIKRLHPEMRLKAEIVADLRPAPGKKFHQVWGKLNSRWQIEHENYPGGSRG